MDQMRVSTDGLNLRREPIVRPDTAIALLPLAHPVTVLGDASRQGWKEITVELDGTTLNGVVSGKFLRALESDAKEALLHETVKEWIRFERGQGKETQDPFFRFVGEMWQAINIDLDGRNNDVPWFAAFISFVVRNANAYQGFKFAAAYSRYIHDSIVERQRGNANEPFWGFRLNEHRPKLGDLVCQWRITPRTFDQAAEIDRFPSHCDVVVELRDTFVRAIGGNVSNSVKMKTYSLNAQGFLKSANNVFAILRNNR